jgi:hypothetical protein
MTRVYDPAWGERRQSRQASATPRRRADDLDPAVQAGLDMLTAWLHEAARDAHDRQAAADPEPLHLVPSSDPMPAPPPPMPPIPKPQPARAQRRDLGHLDAWLTYATLEHWPRFQALIEAAKKPRRKRRMATSRPTRQARHNRRS